MRDDLLLLAGAALFIGPFLLCGLALASAVRSSASAVWPLALAAALLAGLFLPGIPLRSAAATRWLDSPDLLSDAPRRVTASSRRGGSVLLREEIEREFEGDRLIRETRREVVELPLLPLLAAIVWFLIPAERKRTT